MYGIIYRMIHVYAFDMISHVCSHIAEQINNEDINVAQKYDTMKNLSQVFFFEKKKKITERKIK